MKGICVTSEIRPLKKVLLHRPGRELLNLTPDRLPELLFDDIPFLKVAQQEHDAFAQFLRDSGAEVVYLEDLMTEVLALQPELIRPFVYQWLTEGNIITNEQIRLAKSKNWTLYKYLNGSWVELTVSAVRGDLNGDGEVDVTDVDIMIDLVLGKNNPALKPDAVTDLTGDGQVDVSDVDIIIDLVLGKG